MKAWSRARVASVVGDRLIDFSWRSWKKNQIHRWTQYVEPWLTDRQKQLPDWSQLAPDQLWMS